MEKQNKIARKLMVLRTCTSRDKTQIFGFVGPKFVPKTKSSRVTLRTEGEEEGGAGFGGGGNGGRGC